MSVADYNTNPNSNTSISGINIAEGCPPSGINNAIRQMMADIKSKADSTDTAITTLDANVVKLSGKQTVGGDKTFTGAILGDGTDSRLILIGGNAFSNGGRLYLYGKDHSTYPGAFSLQTVGGGGASLIGKNDGALTWNSKEFVYTSGTQPIAGEKTFSDTIGVKSGITDVSIKASGNAGWVRIGGGSDGKVTTGAVLALCGINSGTGNAGKFKIFASDGANDKALIGDPSGTLTWNGQSIQTSSDERLKTPLAAVPDAVLDAWGDVGWGQFQYLEAVEAKGADKARLHLGLIAQRVKAVFEERGLDACVYGILCHEEYPATDEEPAIDLWMVRYTEATAMEAAYQRRRAGRAEARISALEHRLEALEAAFVAVGA